MTEPTTKSKVGLAASHSRPGGEGLADRLVKGCVANKLNLSFPRVGALPAVICTAIVLGWDQEKKSNPA